MNIFSTERALIEVNDYVIIYISPEDVSLLKIDSTAILHNKLGRFKHSDMVGKSFGSRMYSTDGQKYLHLLRPTPELWTRVLPHRTQILYLPDISFILEMLEIKHGSVVVESGTGSASFSHSILRSIGDTGHLYTFEFHEPRMLQATQEFIDHGFSSTVTCSHRNVCTDGFGLDSVANAVFLDLPSPWLAIPWAKQALRKDCLTRIACFSPCIEQVQRTIPELTAHGFHEIQMYEVVLRPLEVDELPIKRLGVSEDDRKRPLSETLMVAKHRSEIKGHTSFLYFASLHPPITSST